MGVCRRERPQAQTRPRRAVRQPAARRAVRLVQGLRARRALYRARRRLSGRDVSGGLQRELSNRSGSGFVAITYELIHDTRVIPIDASPQAEHVSPAIRMYMGDARGHWEGTTLVVETTNLKAGTRGASPDFAWSSDSRAPSKDSIRYEVTFVDPHTWTAPWTAALDLKSRPGEPACTSTPATRATTACATCCPWRVTSSDRRSPPR